MPWAALRLCSSPGCAEPMPCAEHAKPKRHRLDTSGRRIYGARHAKWRARVLAADPICHYPLPDGKRCKRWATVADHVQPISEGGARFDVANGQGLCGACHNLKTAQERAGWIVDTRGKGH